MSDECDFCPRFSWGLPRLRRRPYSEFESEDLTSLLPALRANCGRTWGNECTFRRLDQLASSDAQALVGYWLPASADFAPRYLDALAQEALRNDLRRFTETFRGEPHLLGWLLGDEVCFSLRSLWTPAQRVQFFQFLEALVQYAKTVDPIHPAGYAGASLLPIHDTGDQYAYLPQHVPSLDFYGSNMYGDLLAGGLDTYRGHCTTYAYDKPIPLTVFGPRGWWEVAGGLEAFKDPSRDNEVVGDSGRHRWTLDTAGWPCGIYALRVQTRAGSSAARFTLDR